MKKRTENESKSTKKEKIQISMDTKTFWCANLEAWTWIRNRKLMWKPENENENAV